MNQGSSRAETKVGLFISGHLKTCNMVMCSWTPRNRNEADGIFQTPLITDLLCSLEPTLGNKTF